MMLGIVLRRIRREWQLMGVLLLALSLITAFLSLGPMFVRTVASADTETRLQNLTPRQARIDFSGAQRFETASRAAIESVLGDKIQSLMGYSTSEGLLCSLTFSGEDESSPRPRYTSCYRPYSYDDTAALFDITYGRMPRMRADGVIEVLISGDIVEKSEFLDRSFTLGTGNTMRGGIVVEGAEINSQEVAETQFSFEIVGIATNLLPTNDPFWDNQVEIFGTMVVGDVAAPDQLHFGLIMLPEAFDQMVSPVVADIRHVLRARLEPSAFTVEDLLNFESDITALRSRLLDDQSVLRVDTGMNALIERFNANVAQAETPVLFLAFLVLVLMIYNLVTTVSLIFEQQSREWAMMASRGGSAHQLVSIHLITVSILAGIAFIIGPLIAYGILLFLTNFGPQADIIDAHHIGSIPLNAYLLSGVSTLISIVALTLPAVPMSRGSFLRIRQSMSRPPVKPIWQRYFLDAVLIFLGFAFTLRLYLLVSAASASGEEIGLVELLGDPSLLARLIADSAETNSLNDPFSIAGPVLIIAGLALLWIRIFPYFIRLIGLIVRRVNTLSVHLALWSVEREPGHYAQLVLLLIGILAIGTASLSIAHTRELNAWEVALQTIGADARLTLDSHTLETQVDYVKLTESLSGVNASVPMLYAQNTVAGVDFFGVESSNLMDDGFTTMYPEYKSAFDALLNAEPAQYAGAPLFDADSDRQVAGFDLDVYVQSDDDDGNAVTTTEVIVRLLNDQQQIFEVMLQPDVTEIRTGHWIKYRGMLPRQSKSASWRLLGIELLSARSENVRFDDHFVHLDNFRVIDGRGETTVFESWETDASNGQEENLLWQRETTTSLARAILLLMVDQSLATEGNSSLRVGYGVASTLPTQARINFRPAQTVIPILISPFFATRFGDRVPLEVGTEALSTLDITVDGENQGRLVFRYRVAGILEEFPASDGLFVVATLDDMLYALNTGITSKSFGQNELWVMLEDRQPSEIFRAVAQAAPGVVDVRYAWDRFSEIQSNPLSNAVSGILFAGFWVSLSLILIDFTFYLTVVLRRRSMSFAVLRSMGWESTNLWRMLTVEQATFIAPALIIGVLLGVVIAYIMLPFLAVSNITQLVVPLSEVTAMLTGLNILFVVILLLVTRQIRRMAAAEVLRFGE